MLLANSEVPSSIVPSCWIVIVVSFLLLLPSSLLPSSGIFFCISNLRSITEKQYPQKQPISSVSLPGFYDRFMTFFAIIGHISQSLATLHNHPSSSTLIQHPPQSFIIFFNHPSSSAIIRHPPRKRRSQKNIYKRF